MHCILFEKPTAIIAVDATVSVAAVFSFLPRAIFMEIQLNSMLHTSAQSKKKPSFIAGFETIFLRKYAKLSK